MSHLSSAQAPNLLKIALLHVVAPEWFVADSLSSVGLALEALPFACEEERPPCPAIVRRGDLPLLSRTGGSLIQIRASRAELRFPALRHGIHISLDNDCCYWFFYSLLSLWYLHLSHALGCT
jgi:hypothetical protein